MGPIKRAWKAAGRLTGSSLVLLVVAGVIAVSVARTWAQPLPPCKTPQVIQEIHELKTKVATLKQLVDREEKAWDDASKAWEEACAKKGPGGNCATEQREVAVAKYWYDTTEAQYHDVSVRLEALERLPNCPEVPQTPPPPPPPKEEPKSSAPIHPPGVAVTLTHRQTNCPLCAYAATALNNAIDDYNKYSGSPLAASYLQSVRNRSQELDECEKQCKVQPNSPVTTMPTPAPPQRSPDNRQPLFDWGPYTVPNGPGSVLQPRRPQEYREPSR